MTMTISDAAELKRAVKEKFRVELHLHDTCGGQYFTLDVPPTDALLRYIDKFLAGKRKPNSQATLRACSNMRRNMPIVADTKL